MSLSPETTARIQAKAKKGIPVSRGIRPALASRPFVSDPGDLGRGIYYTTNYHRARCYGEVQKSVIVFSNPLVLSVDDAYALADKYQTVRIEPDMALVEQLKQQGKRWADYEQEQRLRNAEKMTQDLLAQGFDGLISVSTGRRVELEIVDYRPYKG